VGVVDWVAVFLVGEPLSSLSKPCTTTTYERERLNPERKRK
jgi:hypothetical protein